MKAIIDIILAIVFIFITGGIGNEVFKIIRKETLFKVYKGLPSLELYSKRLVNSHRKCKK